MAVSRSIAVRETQRVEFRAEAFNVTNTYWFGRQQFIETAYTLDVTVQELIFVVGPLVTLAAVAGFGARGGLIATALLQVAGTLWFATTPAVRRWRGQAAPRHWAGPLRSAKMRLLLATTVLVGAGVGSIAVARFGDGILNPTD